MVAATAPADLRGTAYGFFNLLSGLALLVSSVIAGVLWETLGSAVTFLAGAGFAALALLAMTWRPPIRGL
jgi:MFS family permease